MTTVKQTSPWGCHHDPRTMSFSNLWNEKPGQTFETYCDRKWERKQMSALYVGGHVKNWQNLSMQANVCAPNTTLSIHPLEETGEQLWTMSNLFSLQMSFPHHSQRVYGMCSSYHPCSVHLLISECHKVKTRVHRPNKSV